MALTSNKHTLPLGDDAGFAEQLRAALKDANLPTLLLVLAQLTGDERWLADPFRPTRAKGLEDHDSAGLSEDDQATVVQAAFDAVCAWRAGDLEPAPLPSPDRVAQLLGYALAEDVPEEYGPLLAEEMGVASRDVEITHAPDASQFRVLVIGAGLSGINVAIQLKKSGVPFTLLDKNDGFGGTWLENAYPGCGVDTPSHLYSFSFAKRSDWKHYFAERSQLHRYFERLADEYELRENIASGTEVLSARWDAAESHWAVHVRRRDGIEETLTANALISAVGHFNRPNIPAIKGLDTFPGPCMHTAQWDRSVEVAGKRVAVVGTGASAMQLVPALAGTAERVLVFQRSRQWCIPHPNCGRAVSPAVQWLLEHIPFYAGFYRLRHFWRFGDRLHPALQVDPHYSNPEWAVNEVNARHRRFLTDYIRSELEGHPELIELSIPDYPAYGKRPLIDHGWYRTIRRDDVDVIEGAVEEVRGGTLVTSDGHDFEADVLALATGFKTLQILGPMQIIGRSGRTLRDTWGEDDARAYMGITVPDFPNFFILFGPNTNTGHGGSAFLTTEMQVRYVMQLLKEMIEGELASVECRRDVHDAYNDEVDTALARTVWTHPQVTNYYRNRAGRIVGTNPWPYVEYWRRTREAELADYIVERRRRVVDSWAAA
jgi:4-hydroxyacetophenone monooxygenase